MRALLVALLLAAVSIPTTAAQTPDFAKLEMIVADELVHVSGHRFTAGDEEIVFVPNAAGTFEHIFLGLYAARRVR